MPEAVFLDLDEVPLEKVLAVNAVIGEAIPDVWEQVQALIGDLFATTLLARQEK